MLRLVILQLLLLTCHVPVIFGLVDHLNIGVANIVGLGQKQIGCVRRAPLFYVMIVMGTGDRQEVSEGVVR